ncbi:MAG: XdhC/CoxI family protein [Flavobacteriales bacterium]|nr:XdhC/CoxI family protein [Flavobacteriales bacterium]
MDIYGEIAESGRQPEKAALCVIVQTKGSAPRKVGAKMIVYESGRISGTIGGGDLERKVIENALAQIERNAPEMFRHDLLHQHNMCCGGSVYIYIEPIRKMNRLYIFGAGHTGSALAQFARALDFDVYVIDDRKEYLDLIVTEGVNKVNMEYGQILPSLPFNGNTYVAIMTYDHAHDRDILAYCIARPHAYLGMIGSRRKVELTRKMFIEAGIATGLSLEQVDMPMGLNIGAESPHEIAISIMAKLIEVKNRKEHG